VTDLTDAELIEWGRGCAGFAGGTIPDVPTLAARLEAVLAERDALRDERANLRARLDSAIDAMADLAESKVEVVHSEPGGWQPIETAPKNGTEVLVWRKASKRWDIGINWGDRRHWIFDSCEPSCRDHQLGGWMPLPPPPAGGESEPTEPAEARVAELEAGGWQPIETAPKDGTDILVLNKEGVFEAYKDRGLWFHLVSDYHGCGCCSGDFEKPSHWMPLPPPPAKQAAPSGPDRGRDQ